MSLLEVRRGVLGGELEQSGQRVQTFRAPPSRVRRPAEETWPSRPLPPEPRSRRSPGAETPSARPPPAYQSHEPETPRGARPARLPPPTRQPAPVQAHPPVHGLTGDMRSSRRSIGALQKGTRLLLRQTPFCCLQLSHPTSLPSLPLP